MSQLRQDPLSERWVVIAKNRGDRPIHLAAAEPRLSGGRCPFCGGNESDTPDALQCIPKSGPWQIRVVPNKFPAVTDAASDLAHSDGLYGWHAGFGKHEVVIEGRQHLEEFAQLPSEIARLTFFAYRERMAHFSEDSRIGYAQVFKNNGAAAGASIPHVHSQILATSQVPPTIVQELSASHAWQATHGDCLLCRILAHELQAGIRIVARTSQLVAFCPFASRFPYEMWVLPTRHGSQFEAASDQQLSELAELMVSLVGRLGEVHSDLAYNFFLHTGPFRTGPLAHYHWHWEILPRLTTVAGYEWGGGTFINPVPPEEAASRLRDAAL